MFDTIKYAKEHKKEFLARVIAGKKNDTAKKQAFFMAGSSGSGKSEYANNIRVLNPNLCYINADDFRTYFPGYTGSNAAEYQKGSSFLVDYIFSWLLDHRYSFLLDATFASSKAEMNVQRSLDHYYKVQINYVYQNPLIVWKFIQKRQQKTGRVVPEEVFIHSFIHSLKNINSVQQRFLKQIQINVLIQDYEDNYTKTYFGVENVISYLPKVYKESDLKEMFSDVRKAKKKFNFR